MQLFRRPAISLQAGSAAALPSKGAPWGWFAVATIIIANMAGLIAYQRYMGGDFPYHDEWRFVGRLQELPHMGMLHYLFAPDGIYFTPVEFLIWYVFYALTHLNIMLIRYTGAVVSAAVALLTCVMLYLKAPQKNLIMWAAICIAPFIVCSFNFWATYGISIESLIKPLMFGIVLATCWAAESLVRPRNKLIWLVLCIVGSLIASGIYAPGLVLLPAIILARFLLRRRLDWTQWILTLVAAALLAAYLIAGHGVGSRGAPSNYTLHDLWVCLYSAFGLLGNAIMSPFTATMGLYTRLVGVLIFGVQIAGMIYAIRQSAELRHRYMIPVTLSLYNIFIISEILVVRFHFPGFEFYPRYAVLMLGGPISMLFWITMCTPTRIAGHALRIGVLVVMIIAVVMADMREYHVAPYRHANIRAERHFLMSLSGEPDLGQQSTFHITSRRLPLIYPGLLYLRANHLAMYWQPR